MILGLWGLIIHINGHDNDNWVSDPITAYDDNVDIPIWTSFSILISDGVNMMCDIFSV
jgi:hypothetical protein